MAEVPVVYEFDVIAGPTASLRTLVAEAGKIAAAFFGADDFELELEVRGRRKQWEVAARATRVVERGH
jgi:hypothetical protein